MQQKDVVIVGAGIGGSALAKVLADDGLDVLVLEQSEVYEDRVRGESMMPWGVAEARRLGVEQVFLDAGAHIAPTWVNYHLPDQRDEIPAGMIIPDIPGSLNLRHPDACAALEQAAAPPAPTCGAAPATSTSRSAPSRACAGATRRATTRCSAGIVVGADGRRSRCARRSVSSSSARRCSTTSRACSWTGSSTWRTSTTSSRAKATCSWRRSIRAAAARASTCPGVSQADRYVGAGNVEKFLADCAFECLPFGKRLAQGRPAGPLATYPGDDTWIDRPYGDGRGADRRRRRLQQPDHRPGPLDRDARRANASATCCAATTGAPAAFGDYGEERTERLRRLRFIANTVAITEAEDADNRDARRAEVGRAPGHRPARVPAARRRVRRARDGARPTPSTTSCTPRSAPPDSRHRRRCSACSVGPRTRPKRASGGLTMARDNFIGGAWKPARSGATDEVLEPGDRRAASTRSRRATPPTSTTRSPRPRAAFETWSDTTPRQRFEMLTKVADAIEADLPTLCDLEIRNVGKPRSIIDFEMDLTVDNWRFFAGRRARSSKDARPASTWRATRRSCAATRSAWSRRSRRGTTRSTWPRGRSGPRSRPATPWC